MTERLTYSIYRIVSVGLFSTHQLTFSFLLCASIMRANTQGVDVSKVVPSPIPSLSASGELPKATAAEEEAADGDGKVVQVGFPLWDPS